MKRRLLNLLTLISLLMFAALIVLAMATRPERNLPSLLSDEGPRIEVDDDSLMVFNRGFPCINVMMGTNVRPPIAFDFAGVHFRRYRLPDATVWWTLDVPLLLLFVLTAVLPALWLIARSRRLARAEAGLCTRCGYDLRATPDKCPECGTTAKAPA